MAVIQGVTDVCRKKKMLLPFSCLAGFALDRSDQRGLYPHDTGEQTRSKIS